MKHQLLAFQAEYIKNKHSRIKWVAIGAFALAPIFGGVFMLLMKDSGHEGLSGAFKTKAVIMSFEANWKSFLNLLTQAVAVGGVLVFGFISSWLFGREYSEGTAKDLLALPVSRTNILNAKFLYYILLCLVLIISNLILGLIIGYTLQLNGWSFTLFGNFLTMYVMTTLMVILLNVPIAFFAIWGKGYLTPLGIVALLLVLAQIIGAMGIGNYFPWSVPGIYSGSGGLEIREHLNIWSYLSVVLTGITGYFATIIWWKYADQN